MAEARKESGCEYEVLRADLFRDRSAIVTGAGSGIGRGIALRLVSLGMSVFGIGRRLSNLDETARLAAGLPGAFAFETCDVRNSENVQQIVRRIGENKGLDLLVNNAGGQFYAPAADITKKGWDAVIDLNLSSVFVLTKAAYPFLRERRGSVVNVSLSSVDQGARGLAHSIAARAGVLGMTRSMAIEWAKDGIRLNCIGPGVVTGDYSENEAMHSRLHQLIGAIPMGRTTSIEEVAELVAFLASPAAVLMTGQLIQIDGAAHLGHGLHMID